MKYALPGRTRQGFIGIRVFISCQHLLISHNVGPERDESQGQRDPHHDIRDDLQLRNVHDHQNDHDHLERGLELAPVVGGDHDAVLCGHQAESADDEFSRHDDHDDPGRDPAQLDQADHAGDCEDLVRQGIHELSEVRDKIIFSCNVAVREIGQRGDDEERQGHPFQGVVRLGEQQRCNKERNQYHTHNSEFIRQIHNNPPIRSYSLEPVIFTFTRSPVISSLCVSINTAPSMPGASL